ncbi:MAG: prepilin-type N-terminal cleavage/methylation domain-containing protein [Sedimentisphaerales bacterium]|jgi:prepilin-type N-terminal cleavage/methylation domain-containing protein
MKQAFTLTELVVVISIIGLLMGMLLPAVSRAREQAKVTVVNAELRQIGIALDMYFDDNRKFPPTHEDCGTGKLTDHLYQLPRALITSHYLPSTPKGEAMTTNLEDRYHLNHTYKYRSVGEIIKSVNKIEKFDGAQLWIPNNFPASSSINTEEGRWRPDENECNPQAGNGCQRFFPLVSPVSWVVFSLGPNFSQYGLDEKLGADNSNRYPVPKELWYTPKERMGFIVRMRIKNGSQIGSFEGN